MGGRRGGKGGKDTGILNDARMAKYLGRARNGAIDCQGVEATKPPTFAHERGHPRKINQTP